MEEAGETSSLSETSRGVGNVRYLNGSGLECPQRVSELQIQLFRIGNQERAGYGGRKKMKEIGLEIGFEVMV